MTGLNVERKHVIAAGLVAAVVVFGAAAGLSGRRATVQAAAATAPRFEVDPMWPKPLPNHWVIGSVIGVAVDASDHIWIIHREGSLEDKEKYAKSNPPASEC